MTPDAHDLYESLGITQENDPADNSELQQFERVATEEEVRNSDRATTMKLTNILLEVFFPKRTH
jgi:hypothetical protein